MGQPVVTIYINTGTEGTPVWTEITSKASLFLTGPASSFGYGDNIDVPRTSFNVGEEAWLSKELYYVSGTQSSVFTIPSSATQNQNVIKVTFADYDTTNAPKLKAWDDSGADSNTKKIFAGTTTSSSSSLLKATETTGGAAAQNWCTITTETAGAATTNSLKGSTNYVQCSAVASADTSKYFNLALFSPNDLVTLKNTDFNIYLQIEYDY